MIIPLLGLGSGLANLPVLGKKRSRAITAENPTGAKGKGGQAASHLGVARKGRPCLEGVQPGETVTLAEIAGPGIIQHIWFTVADRTEAGDYVLRDLVLRFYWDGASQASVEAPVGDFFCNGHARRSNVNAQAVSVHPSGGFNCYWPMPFQQSCRVTLENQHAGPIPYLFYQVDYSEVDELPPETAYFHAQWRRTNPQPLGQDYTILETSGSGVYVGTYLAWTQLGSPDWWGEGEVKFYIDGDQEWPTICGTGTEDYFGGAWAFGETYSGIYLGYPLWEQSEGKPPLHGLYRFHVLDSIRFEENLRVTVQDIGNSDGLFERSDDISSVAFWYQKLPQADFPALPPREERWPVW